MKKYSVFALSIAFMAGVVSCGDEQDEPTPATKTKTELLTGKNWRISAHQSVSVANGVTTTRDDFAEYQECEKDDAYTFNVDQTMVDDYGANQCWSPTNNPQIVKGTWKFNAEETTLTYYFPLMPQGATYDLLDLNATTLKLKLISYYDTDGDGTKETTATHTLTYTAF